MASERPDFIDDDRPTRAECDADERDILDDLPPLTFAQRVRMELQRHTATLDVELAEALGVVIFP